MPSKEVKLEFVTDEQRQSRLIERLTQIENEVVNAQIDLELEKAVGEATKQQTPGAPGSDHMIANRQLALDAALARLAALRAMRDGAGTPAKA